MALSDARTSPHPPFSTDHSSGRTCPEAAPLLPGQGCRPCCLSACPCCGCTAAKLQLSSCCRKQLLLPPLLFLFSCCDAPVACDFCCCCRLLLLPRCC